mgnify:CR=1 FL=1
MGVLAHSIFNLFSLYFDTNKVADAVVKIIAYISQPPCIYTAVFPEQLRLPSFIYLNQHTHNFQNQKGSVATYGGS